MRKTIRLVPLLLFTVIILAGIAATPAALTRPNQPTVVATENSGELRVSWNRVAGAQFYTVGYANPDEMNRMTAAGRESLDAFYYVTIKADNTSHTLTGLEPETVYWVLVGAQTKRFGATDLVWGQYAEATTAGQHGAGFCPITGLPLPDEGYLGIGDKTTSGLAYQSFTLIGASTPGTITHSHANDPTQQFSPRKGRRFVEVCGTYQHYFGGESSIFAGSKTIIDSDAGVGFIQHTTYQDIAAGTVGFGCQVWDLPAAAQTAIYVVGLGGYNPETGLSGKDSEGVGLYRIDLTELTETALTPLTNQELTRLVKPALAQIIATNSDGETFGGTGFVVTSNGILVTNRHVVDDAQTVIVRMNTLDGRTLQLTGNVLGRGILADLAVVQLPEDRTYATLSLANSDIVSGLDAVTAWGYPGGSISGTYPTITRGVISSKGVRGDVDFLQTDAAINPGNSGGPLIDQYGHVVGVNSLKSVGTAIDNQGFAIASNEVADRLDTLINGGPDSETYRNVKYGYGYSVDIPRGWYLEGESSRCTQFLSYDDTFSGTSLCTWRFSNTTTRAADLDLLVSKVWDSWLSIAEESNWPLIERVWSQELLPSEQSSYRLGWRARIDAGLCIDDEVTVVALSSSYPQTHLGFELGSGACERASSQYFIERAAILNSFRP